MTRSIRKLAACLGIAALLIMQLAVTAYACASFGDIAMSTEGSAQGGVSSQMDKSSPDPLCVFHCGDGQASLDKAKPATGAPLPAMALTDVIRVAIAAPQSPPSAYSSSPLARTGDPPLIIRNCCLRI